MYILYYIYLLYIFVYIHIYLYIVIKEKNNNILKVKIFPLLALSIHNLSLYKFRFESHISLNSYRGRYNLVQGTNRRRFNLYNKNW